MELEGLLTCSQQLAIYPTVKHIRPVQALSPFFIKISVNVNLTSKPRFSEFFSMHIPPSIRTTGTAHFNLLYLVTMIYCVRS